MSGQAARSRLRLTVRRGIAQLLYVSGVLKLWTRLVLRRRAVVLMYHRVLNDEALAASCSNPAIVVRPETFNRQLRVLLKYFDVLTPEAFVQHLQARRPFSRPSCLITFDDGWRDTYTEAWPLLESNHLTALVFLPADYIGTGRVFWQEQLVHLLVEAGRKAMADRDFASRLAPVLATAGFEKLLQPASSEPLHNEARRLVNDRKAAGPAAVAGLVRQLGELLGPEVAAHASEDVFVSWEMVGNMAASGMRFGSHSVSHRIMTTLTKEEVAAEVSESHRLLSERLEQPVETFSYPNGDWNHAVADQVKAHGFALSFSTEPGSVSVDDDPFSLRRVNVHEYVTSTDAMFLARIVGCL
jgi:peptidoglycan/xylan/chitin deacetylase (PgdA/CDA1 family)